jgi:hypothetical protein
MEKRALVFVIWIASWTVRWWEPQDPDPHALQAQEQFTDKEAASQFLARCQDCDPPGEPPRAKDDICCDHKTLEPHE